MDAEVLPIVEIPKPPTRHTLNAASPFRYPGGKAFLAEFLRRRLPEPNGSQPTVFAEPFCGGAGAAMNLLADGHVDCLLLNDADLKIYSTWYAMLMEPKRFVDAIYEIPLTMNEWYQQRDLASNHAASGYSFELGFATFYLNRTTRSGIVERAGPIGGHDQSGKWKIDARFNREKLASQVQWIASKRDAIQLSNLDALNFIDKIRRSSDLNATLLFIDPPYVRAGGRLYFDGMTEAKHVALSDVLLSKKIPHWVLTYDDAAIIRELYKDEIMSHISVNYSLQSKRKESELLILPNSLKLSIN
jgi:DNA adenine methylase